MPAGTFASAVSPRELVPTDWLKKEIVVLKDLFTSGMLTSTGVPLEIFPA